MDLVPPYAAPHAPAGIPIYGPCRHRFTEAEAQSAQLIRNEEAKQRLAVERERAAEREREKERRKAIAAKRARVDSQLPALPQPARPADVEGKGVLPIFLSPILFVLIGSLTSAAGSSSGKAWVFGIVGTLLVIGLAELRPIARLRRADAMLQYEQETRAADTREGERQALYEGL